MLLYSHLSIGYQVMKNTDLDMSYFYTGSISPDVRFIQGLPREQTHFSMNYLQGILAEKPPRNLQEKSYNLGYSMHLLTDYMFNLFTRTLRINPILLSLLLEEYYLKHHPVKNLAFNIPKKSGLIDTIGIDREKLKEIIDFCEKYQASPNIQTAFRLVPKELVEHLNKYMKTAQGSAKFIKFASIFFTPFFWYINRKIVKHLNKIKS